MLLDLAAICSQQTRYDAASGLRSRSNAVIHPQCRSLLPIIPDISTTNRTTDIHADTFYNPDSRTRFLELYRELSNTQDRLVEATTLTVHAHRAMIFPEAPAVCAIWAASTNTSILHTTCVITNVLLSTALVIHRGLNLMENAHATIESILILWVRTEC